MNTITVVMLSIFIILMLVALFYILKGLVQSKDKNWRWFYIFALLGWLLGNSLFVLVGLNAYGVARLPVLNEVSKRMPENYVAPEPIQPPTQGSTQPSSQPTIDDHKARMDKLKKDGF